MTDSEINLGFKKIVPLPTNILLVPPSIGHLIKMQDDKEICKEICDGLKLNDFEFIVCAVNNRLNEMQEGGDHWSLLVSEKRGSLTKFYHWDSAGGINTSEARRLAVKLRNYMTVDGGSDEDVDNVGGGVWMESVPCRQQSGGVECGAYTLHNAELVCSLVGKHMPLFDKKVFMQAFSVCDIYNNVKSDFPSSLSSTPLNDRYESLAAAEPPENQDFTVVQKKRKSRKMKGKKRKSLWVPQNQLPEAKSGPIALPFCNVTIQGDSHARHLAGLIRELVSPTTIVTGMCKPGAGLLKVVNVRSTKTSADHCHVLVAGSNDVAAGKHGVIFSQMEAVIHQYSRVIICTLPHRYDLTPRHPVNRTIGLVNSYLTELCSHLESAILLDISCIRRHEFTSHGMHLRACGKRHLARMIALALAGVSSPSRHCRSAEATGVAESLAFSNVTQKPGKTVPHSYAEALRLPTPTSEPNGQCTSYERPELETHFLGPTATVSSPI